jgi:hypothetical protein
MIPVTDEQSTTTVGVIELSYECIRANNNACVVPVVMYLHYIVGKPDSKLPLCLKRMRRGI